MRFSTLFAFFLFSTVGLISGLTGCRKEISPEQLQADSALVRARDAIALGQHHKGRALLIAALSFDEHLNRIAQVAEEFKLLAENYGEAAEFDSALSMYSRASDQYSSLAERDSVCVLTLKAASLYRLMGMEKKAYSVLIEALRLSQVFGEIEGAREIQWALVPVCRALHKTGEETKILTELLNGYIVAGDFLGQARLHFEIGKSKQYRQEYNGAVESFLQGLTFADQVGDSLLSIQLLMNLGQSYGAQGKSADAFKTYTEGLKRSDVTSNSSPLREEILMHVANIYYRNGQLGEAARFYRAALGSVVNGPNKIAEGYLFIQLGHCDVATPTTLDEGIKNYNTALELFNGVSYLPGSVYALTGLGRSLQRQNKFAEAIEYFKTAIEQSELVIGERANKTIFDECKQVFFNDPLPSAYDGMIELLLQLGRYDEAFWYVERRNSRELFDVLGALDAHTRNDGANVALQEYDHQKRLHIGAEHQYARLLMTHSSDKELLADVRGALDRTTKSLQDDGGRVVVAAPELSPMVRITHLGLAETQKLLPERTALIEHVATSRSLYMFIVTRAKAAVQVAALEKNRLLPMVKEFMDLLRIRAAYADSAATQASPADSRFKELTGLLYGTLIRPMEANLVGLTKLLLVPDKDFASFPFHALRKDAGRARSPYLIEQYAVSYLPAAVSLSMKSTPTQSAHDVVALGYPGETSWDVEYELRDIRAFNKDARLYFNQQATLATLQREQADIVHIAAEFQFDPQAPGNSYLVLSDGKAFNTSQYVFWGELFSLPGFSTVILSDLSNSGGAIHGAQPMIFLMNGSRTVILNGLPSMRRAKKVFGEIFYTSLLAGSTSAAAFRQAQMEMIKDPHDASSYFWAPFFLWGQ